MNTEQRRRFNDAIFRRVEDLEKRIRYLETIRPVGKKF